MFMIFQINNLLLNKQLKCSIFEVKVVDIFKKYSIFYVFVFTILLLGFVLHLVLAKGELVLLFDSKHTLNLDSIFMWITKGGELYGGIAVALILLAFKKMRFLGIFAVSILLSLAVSQGLKHGVFPDELRPIKTHTELHKIDGLERHKVNSFPSGHTTAAFTYFTMVALAFRRKWISIFAPVCATMVGLSRVYLGQHYLNDIVAGAVLGVFIVTTVTVLANKKWPESV
jgi:membrane-associated phospholipid phosphatase